MASDRLRGNRSGEVVVLDSSALIMIFEFSIDLEDELTRLIGKYNIIILNQIIEELKLLSINGKGKKRINSKAALKFARRFKEINTEGKNADDAIFNYALKNKCVVVTNDRELRHRLKNNYVKVIYLRSKNKLEMK